MIIKKLLHNTFFWFAIWILWMGIIFTFSHLPGSPTYYEPSLQLLLERKGAHVIEYFVLTLLSAQLFSLVFLKESLQRLAVLALVWSFAYAALDELHQFFTPFRGAQIQDVAIDGVGILLALLLFLVTFSSQTKKQTKGKRKKTRA